MPCTTFAGCDGSVKPHSPEAVVCTAASVVLGGPSVIDGLDPAQIVARRSSSSVDVSLLDLDLVLRVVQAELHA